MTKEADVSKEHSTRALTLPLCPAGNKFRLDDSVRLNRQADRFLVGPLQEIKPGQLALMLALLCSEWRAGWTAGLLFCPVLELLFSGCTNSNSFMVWPENYHLKLLSLIRFWYQIKNENSKT